MIKQLNILLVLILSFQLQAQDEQTNSMDTVAYGFGMMQAMDLKKNGLKDMDVNAYMEAFVATMKGEKTKINSGEARQAITQFMEAQKANIEKMNAQQGVAFLEENAKREGVTVLESGLQYEVINAGDGEIPTASSTVTTHYTGTLIDGTVFDSSVQRGEPISFPVGGVIQGWQEALQIMPKGAKWKLFIPQELAYGARGAGNVIPPFAALVFEIELLDVK